VAKTKEPPKLNLKKLSKTREPLKNAGPEREACIACGLCKQGRAEGAFARPSIPDEWTGLLLVVSEGNETPKEQSFVRRMWKKAGWNDNDVSVVPAVRCASRRNASMVHIRACRPFLLQVIAKLHPKHIIGIGATAMRALNNAGETNITKKRGKEILVQG